MKGMITMVSKDKYRVKKLDPVVLAKFRDAPVSRESVEAYCLKIDRKGKKGRKQS